MIKVGKYTAALLLVTVGTVLLIDLSLDTEWMGKLVDWWPAILIGVGLEYLVLGTLYRDPEKRVGLAFGSLFFSVILCVVVIGFTHASDFNIFRNWNINIGPMSFADESGIKFEKGVTTADVGEDINKVYLKNPNGNVKLIPGDVAQIEIDTTLYVPKSKKDDADEIAEQSKIRIHENGSTLEIITEGKEYKVFGVKQKPRMNLVVTVPRDLAKDFELDLTNGKVEADGIAIDDTFKADTTNGSILVSNLTGEVIADTTNGTITVKHVKGNLRTDTTNGTITASDIEGDVTADTTNGKIKLERITGTVKTDTTNGSIDLTDVADAVTADTVNGSVTVRTNELGGNWKLDTTNGKIEVYLPEDASFTVDGDAGVARNISTDFPLDVNKDEVTGSVNGGEFKIGIDTNSGIGIYRNR